MHPLNKFYMARKKKALPLIENVTKESCAADGKSIARLDGMVIFVPFCVPGDVVDLQLTRKKHSYAEAKVVNFREYSKVRAIPMCEHFGVCGGCKWQNLPYEEQLKMKQQQVYDHLFRIGHLKLPRLRNILGSKKTQEYRNKLEFGCANKRWLTSEELYSLPPAPSEGRGAKDVPAVGFHITGAFDKIVPIEKCWLMDDQHNRIRNEIRDFAIATDMTFFDLRQQTGLLRDVIIRNSNSGEWMVIVQFHLQTNDPTAPADWSTEDGQKALALMQHLHDKFPKVSSLLYLDNQKPNDTIGDQEILVYSGNDHIFELMEDLRFKVGPKSFYQTNTEQAYELYKVVRELAFPREMDENAEAPLIYDLYTGTGTIANFVAKKARRVIGIEWVPEAIEDAKINSEINGIDNTLFFAGDMRKILTDEFIAEYGRPDILITDPPRAGMHPDVVQVILNAAPKRIVYVSCNPPTQARDLALMESQYKISVVQPVDMFPHTPHVENVVLLERIEEKMA